MKSKEQADAQRKKRHIRAARDWLTEADDSLEQGKGLKGDLKMMLAQAELKHASETTRPARTTRFLWRALPLLTAVLLAAGGYAIFRGIPSEHAQVPAAESVQKTKGQEHQSTAPEAEAEEKQAVPVLEEQAPPAASPPAMPQEVQPAPAPESEPEAAAAPPASGPEAGKQAVRLPSPEAQKLMQSAGKVLREP